MKRLVFYINHIKNEVPMNADDMDKAMSFIHEKEAGEFIAYLAEHPCSGAVNGCSDGDIRISEIIDYIEKKSGKAAIIDMNGDDAPFNGVTDTLSFNTEKAGEQGIDSQTLTVGYTTLWRSESI